MAGDLAREAGDESGQPAARAVRQSERLDRRLDRGRGDVDDATEFALDHAVDRRLDQLDRRQHVGVEGADPHIAIPIPEIAGRRAAGVVDEDVGLRARRERRGPALRRRDVAGDPLHAGAGLRADFLRSLPHRAVGARADRHRGAFARERLRATTTQALARGADQRVLSGDAEVHVSSPEGRARSERTNPSTMRAFP